MFLTRNRRLGLGAVCTALLILSIWRMSGPDIYEANTLILVDPQKLPDYYVHSTVSMSISSRLNTINQQLMSSTRLQRIIDTYHLYPELSRRKTREEILEVMRKNIRVEIIHSFDGLPDEGVRAFRIYYRGRQAPLVAQVCNQLASLFIEENLKVREQQAQGTSEFINTRLDLAHKKLLTLLELKAKSHGASKEDQELWALDYSAIRDEYTALLKKKLEADTAADLEKRQKSERFTILDPARIPEKPIGREFFTAGW